MTSAVDLGLVAAGVVLLSSVAVPLRRWRRERAAGRLVAVETDGGGLLRSERYRLVGRPDEVRATVDGTLVPIELKHRNAPERRAFYSHTVQLWAYCLLLEESTGRSPPFGVLRYTDRDERVPWNAEARAALLELKRRAVAPYDGAADPSPGKCRKCPWTARCDASLA